MDLESNKERTQVLVPWERLSILRSEIQSVRNNEDTLMPLKEFSES